MTIRRKLFHNLDIDMLMTSTLNSALYRNQMNEDLQEDNGGPAKILHIASTVKTQVIIIEEKRRTDTH